MSRSRALPLALLVCACGCSPAPQGSGTKTNWLEECDTAAECGEEGSCICGLCTRPCDEADNCPGGRCASVLSSAAQCQSAGTTPVGDLRICLPDQGGKNCSAFSVSPDFDLEAAPADACTRPNSLLCETFDEPLPERTSTWIEGGMSVELQDCLVDVGAGAIRYRGTGDAFSQTRFQLAEPAGDGNLHVRFTVRVPSAVVLPPQLQLFELWNAPGGSDERATVFLSSSGLPSLYVGASNETLEAAPRFALPRDQWVCFEMSLTLADGDGSAALDVDGERAVERSGIATLGAAPFSVAVVEALLTSAASEVDVYLDDLIVSTAPVGCP